MRLEESEQSDKGKSTDGESSDDEIMARTKTPARMARQGGLFSSSQRRRATVDDESEDELMSATPKRSSPLKRLRQGSKQEASARRNTRSSRRRQAEDDSEDEEVAPSTRRRKSSVIEISEGEAESSGDDAPELYSSPGRKRQNKQPKRNVTKSYSEDDGFVVLSDEDSEDAPRHTSSRKKPSRKSKATKSTKEDSFMVSDDEDVQLEDEEDEAPVRKRRLKRRHHEITDVEQEELDEDVENLRSSPPDARKRKRKPNAREEAMAALKRSRAGVGNGRSSPSPQANGHQRYSGDTSEEEEYGEADADEEYEVAAAVRRRGALDGEDEEDDFVVSDDENEPLGMPDDVDIELPIWLTGLTRMKPKELFRFAVEWMVQKKLNPAYNQEKEKYDITFQRLDDEVRGLAGSKFTSSAWTRDFTISLQARPGIELTELHGLLHEIGEEKCMACNRSGHPATYQIQFTGRPYDPRTLEPLEQDGDDEDSDEDDDNSADSDNPREEYDHKSRLVPPESKCYNVGRFCKDNAMTAHALEHWKFQLNCWIVEKLEEDGHLTDKKVVKRDKWDEPRRRKYARKVVEVMEENGDVRELWRQFREEIDSAREKKSGWQREKEIEF